MSRHLGAFAVGSVDRKIYQAIKFAPNGLTALELAQRFPAMSISTHISSIRKHIGQLFMETIETRYDHTTESGERVYRNRVKPLGTLFGILLTILAA